MDPIALVSRCIHILAAVVLFGGAIFTRFVLMPSAATLPDDQHRALKEQISARWRYVVAVAIAALIITGFYNYLLVQGPQLVDPGDRKFYHPIMGTKIILAFVIFFFASALAGRSAKLEWVRKKASTWLLVTIILATAVVVLGGVLKVRGIKSVAHPPAAQAPDK